MLATELSLKYFTPGALMIYSGCLYCDEWKEKAKERKGMKVVQFHGQQDMVLPYQQAVMLNQALKAANCDASFFSFGGGHTIPQNGIEKMDEVLTSLASESCSV